MDKQSGMSAVATAVVVAALAAVGAGLFAWQKMGEADRLRRELDTAWGEVNKARLDLRKAAQDLAAAAKQAGELKVAAERLSAERDAVRASMETEQAAGVSLRAELALAKEQVSYLSARTSKDVVRGMPKAPAGQAAAAPQRK
jgi:hypothetical protein